MPTGLILKWAGRYTDWLCPAGVGKGDTGGGNKLSQAGHETDLVLGVWDGGMLSQAGPQTGAVCVWLSEQDSRSTQDQDVMITLVEAAFCQYEISTSSYPHTSF